MSDSLFNAGGTLTPAGNQGGAATPPNSQSTDPFADLLGSIKNEQGQPKYKDVQTALEALRHSQEFIPQLKQKSEEQERRLAELAAENEKLKTVEQTLARLTSGEIPLQGTPPAAATPAVAGLSAEDVAKLVQTTLSSREAEVVQKTNISKVISKASELYGAEAEKVFYNKAKELGLSQKQVNDLAKEAPDAVFHLFGWNASVKPSFPSSTSSTVNTAGYQPRPQSFLGRNENPVILGASSDELKQENINAKQLVEELHGQGLSTYDLTDPKVYFKYFNKGK